LVVGKGEIMPDVETFFEFLKAHGIGYARFDHPPVYTVDDVKRLVPKLDGAETKNLFFRGKKQRYFLVAVPADRKVDIKALSGALGAGHLSFGSAERLMEHLGVEPGSVTLLAVFNDRDNRVEVVIDETLWESEAFQFHPLVNTATLVISKENLFRFLDLTGNPYRILPVPFVE